MSLSFWRTLAYTFIGAAALLFGFLFGAYVFADISYESYLSLIAQNDLNKVEPFFVLKQDVPGGYYRKDFYQTPSGEYGYQVLFFNSDNVLEFSQGYGPEERERTFTPVYPVNNTSSEKVL